MTLIFSKKKYRCARLLCGALVAVLAACSDDIATVPPQPTVGEVDSESVAVPVSITFGGTYALPANTTRSAPPGAATDPYDPKVDGEAAAVQTDQVRIVAFRRKVTGDDEASSEAVDEAATISDSEFVYDPTNDQKVMCSRASASDHRLTATGKLKKMRGYQYRVIAVAYSSSIALPPSHNLIPAATGEQNLFMLNLQNGTTLAEAQADIVKANVTGWKEFLYGSYGLKNDDCLSGYLSYAPQLFYGECHTAMGNRVVHFREQQSNGEIISNSPLTGVLYRGMARVEMTLSIDKQSKGGVHWVALMANHTNTAVKLNSYDAFAQAFNPITQKLDKDSYTVIAMAEGNDVIAEGSTITLGAWVLPTATRLALRVFCKKDLQLHQPLDYPITTANVSSAEQGTGIIAPDVSDNTYYLRRNQLYRFKGKLSTITGKSKLGD